MASLKSHTIPPSRSDPQAPSTQRHPSTRLPSRSTAHTTSSKASIPPPTTGKLHKKRSTKENEAGRSSSGKSSSGSKPKASQPSVAERSRAGREEFVAPSTHGPSTMSSRHLMPGFSTRSTQNEGVMNTRTPSLVSGSSVSTIDSPRSVMLRRKPSTIGRPTPQVRQGSLSSQDDQAGTRTRPIAYVDPFHDSVLGISLPQSTAMQFASEGSTGKQTELYLSTHDLPPPTAHYAASATPSTGYSASPSAFSHVSTPTSMSSHSPGLAVSQKPTKRSQQMSPFQSRPPISRRTTDENARRGLASVRESSASSSSASTVRHPDLGSRSKGISRDVQSQPPETSSGPLKKPLDNSARPERRLSASQRPNARPKAQAPPELAHLAVEPPRPTAQVRAPVRPSRDNTPELSGLRQFSPVIQSNMTSLPSHHRRNSSMESKLGLSPNLSNSSKTQLAPLTKIPSRNPSPAPTYSPFPSTTSRIPVSRGTTPDLQSDSEKQSTKGKPMTAPSPVKSGSRFGFFRRAKTDPDAAPKPEKKLRKGPAAGTGHEGYGRYATRGRSGSTTSLSGVVSRSTSQDSATPTTKRTSSSRKSSLGSQTSTEMDDYFRKRLSPVVIRGGSADLCRSPEDFRRSASIDSATNSVVSPGAESNTSSVTIDTAVKAEVTQPKSKLLPSAISDSRGSSPLKRFGFGSRRPSDSEEEKRSGHVRPVITRQSLRQSQLLQAGHGMKSSDVSRDVAPSPRPAASEASVPRKVDVSEGKEGNWLKPKKAVTKKDQSPQKLTRKWNFFQRAAQPSKDVPEKASGMVQAPPSRSMPHYAMMDGVAHIDLDDIERIMEEADKSSDELQASHSDIDEQGCPNDESQNKQDQPSKRVQSMLLPSPPLAPPPSVQTVRSASPRVMLRKEHPAELASPIENVTKPSYVETAPVTQPAVDSPVPSNPTTNAAPPRPSRLVPLGRIPKVVSKRDRDVKLSNHSFSRPFVPTQPSPAVQVPRTSIDSIQVPLIAETTVLSDAFPAYSGLITPLNQAAFEVAPLFSTQPVSSGEFLKFPPRKDSQVSCSSSSGIMSFSYPAGFMSPLAAPLSEDEVWNEYDDLIDDVLSPADEFTVSPFGSHEKSPETARPADHDANQESGAFKPSHSSHTSISSHPQSVHLRRSRLLSALQAGSPNSHTFPSVSDLHSQYGERSLSIIDPTSGRLSLQASKNDMSSTSRPGSIRSSLPASVGATVRQSRSTLASTDDKRGSSRYRDTKLIEMAENEKDGLESMANLRFGALMTSKWLSFGRVLFSPIHYELKDMAEDRVLVIDGLGKDWSYYCALTYPEATIFSLNSSGEPGSSTTPWSNVPNHRHVHHANMQAMFPFPNRYFAAVVYRFPLAASETTYKNCIAECKRVLRPGGYLEMSVLDLDLINMGNRARRAMRGLKLRMQVQDPDVNLRPVSDMVMKMIGRKGFENINRCNVAVPVAAGRMTSWSSDSSGGDEPHRKQSAKVGGKDAATRSSGLKKKSSKKRMSRLRTPMPNFTDLLGAPPSPDPAVANEADANISDMVARVGRWWYSRCYENTTISEGDLSESLWDNGALLRECENRGTSFRLLVAYAQKPMLTVRRTVSV